MQYHALIRGIIDWNDFNSYWFQQGAIDAIIAKEKIENLKKILGEKTRKEEKREENKKKTAKLKEIRDRKITIEILRKEFYEMCQKKDGAQSRGYQMEKFLQKLFTLFNIDVFKPFKLIGEQVDGAIKFENDNYTFESKWQDKETACNQLYHFAFQIESNNLYPRGIFFSIQGYTNESLKRICHNKQPQLILFDAIDFVMLLEERITLDFLLKEKIRFA